LGFVNHPDGPFLTERLLAKNFESDFVSMDDFESRVFINQISRILDPVAAGLGFTVLPEGAYRNFHSAEKLSVVRLKTKVADEVYKVHRKNEKLPNRYMTVEKVLKQN
jgi:DNA-binding transcriptional LysR family regulator